MKGSAVTIVIIIVCILIFAGMLVFISFKVSNPSQTAATSSNPNAAISSAPVKDFAPGMPMSQKTTILIQTSDSSDIKYIVPTNQMDTYVKSLPEGYRVVSKTP